jgi:hypothetical protein
MFGNWYRREMGEEGDGFIVSMKFVGREKRIMDLVIERITVND